MSCTGTEEKATNALQCALQEPVIIHQQKEENNKVESFQCLADPVPSDHTSSFSTVIKNSDIIIFICVKENGGLHIECSVVAC